MESLRELVESLEKESREKEQIQILQEIGAKLINEYEIKLNGLTIKPLLVEAYYYHEGKFNDTSVYAYKCFSGLSDAKSYKLADVRQKDNFCKLFMHYGMDYGIDVVLSQKEDYYLSYLIKVAMVNGECKKQCDISKAICASCVGHGDCVKGLECERHEEEILEHKAAENQGIVFLPRKNITNDFASKPLAALSVEAFKNKDTAEAVTGSLESGYKKQWAITKYALKKADFNEAEARRIAKEEGLYKAKIEDKYFVDVKQYIEKQEM